MKKTYSIEIEYGSDFQRKAWTNVVESAMSAMQEMVQLAHSKNKFKITESNGKT